jgi:hypothetical protein
LIRALVARRLAGTTARESPTPRSSLRTQGPITTGPCCCRRRQPVRQTERPRGMGPGSRFAWPGRRPGSHRPLRRPCERRDP